MQTLNNRSDHPRRYLSFAFNTFSPGLKVYLIPLNDMMRLPSQHLLFTPVSALCSLLAPLSLSALLTRPSLPDRPLSLCVLCTLVVTSSVKVKNLNVICKPSQFIYGLLAKASKHGTDFQTSNFLVEFDKTMTKNIGLL